MFCLFAAAAFEWIDEHKRLLQEVEGRSSDTRVHAVHLAKRDAEIDRLINLNRPECSRLIAVNCCVAMKYLETVGKMTKCFAVRVF